MDDSKRDLRKIGEALAEHSRQAPVSARGMVHELFPYIAVASERMSSRAISRWLDSEQNMKLSAATIARALRESKKYILDIYEEIEPAVNVIRLRSRLSLEQILTDWDDPEEPDFNEIDWIDVEDQEEQDESSKELNRAWEIIRERWFPMPLRFRRLALDAIRESEEAENQESERVEDDEDPWESDDDDTVEPEWN